MCGCSLVVTGLVVVFVGCFGLEGLLVVFVGGLVWCCIGSFGVLFDFILLRCVVLDLFWVCGFWLVLIWFYVLLFVVLVLLSLFVCFGLVLLYVG